MFIFRDWWVHISVFDGGRGGRGGRRGGRLLVPDGADRGQPDVDGRRLARGDAGTTDPARLLGSC